MDTLLIAVIVLGLLGLLFGMVLAYSSKKFAVKVDPKIQEIMEILPGLNCGACGYAGCMGYAEALVNDDVDLHLCKPGGKETVEQLAVKLGKEAKSVEKMCAVIKCQGNLVNSPEKTTYRGIKSCSAAAVMGGINKSCKYSCLGQGDCVSVCPVEAIKMEQDKGIPIVIRHKCIECGKCVTECPRDLIEMTPLSKEVHILCKSNDLGPIVRTVCKAGCIGCGICVKNCPTQAISMENNLAFINYEKCTNCGVCVTKCPTKAIKHFLTLKSH
ncbi:RnfABCDGE type electron transport complex subunit B [bacterium]